MGKTLTLKRLRIVIPLKSKERHVTPKAILCRTQREIQISRKFIEIDSMIKSRLPLNNVVDIT